MSFCKVPFVILFVLAVAYGEQCSSGETCPPIMVGAEDADSSSLMQSLQVTQSLQPALESIKERTRKEDSSRNRDQLQNNIMELYLNQVRDTLTGTTLATTGVVPGKGAGAKLQRLPFDSAVRWAGSDWCEFCYTMAGGARVQNVRELVQTTIQDGIPGDFLEAGTWRGGCSIMARVVQRAMQEGSKRRTYLCDSYSGLPKSSTHVDVNDWADMKFLEVAQSDVEENFRKFGMLDDQVKFRKAYFSESMPRIRKEFQDSGRKLAVLRGDGDMYESYMDILYNLYEFIPVGGYFICDDCPGIPEAQHAIDAFRQANGISELIHPVNTSAAGTYWRKEVATLVNYTRYLEWNATRIFQKKD